MWLVIKRLSLGTFLIGLLSWVLLVSDWHQRTSGAQRIPRLAILVYSSQPVLLQGFEGALEALKDNGFVDGQNLVLRQYNAEGDIGTVNTIARQITRGIWWEQVYLFRSLSPFGSRAGFFLLSNR